MGTTVFKETIHLSDIEEDDSVSLMLPSGAEILTVAEQFRGSRALSVWYRCCPAAEKVIRKLYIVGTGNPAPNKSNARYLSTVILADGALVLHAFDKVAA